MPYRRPRHATLETNMPDRRPIEDLNMLHRRPTCLIGDLDILHRKPICLIGDPLETSTCYIEDWHAWSVTHQKLDMLHWRTDMPDRRPINDLNILHQRPTCLIRDPSKTSTCYIGGRHAWSEINQRPTCPIGNWHSPSETDMPDWRPIGDLDSQNASLDTSMPDQRTIGEQHAPLVTYIPHRRQTCLCIPIGDQHAWRVQKEFYHINISI